MNKIKNDLSVVKQKIENKIFSEYYDKVLKTSAMHGEQFLEYLDSDLYGESSKAPILELIDNSINNFVQENCYNIEELMLLLLKEKDVFVNLKEIYSSLLYELKDATFRNISRTLWESTVNQKKYAL